MDDPFLVLIRILYVGLFIGTLAFLLLWEDGNPRVPFASPKARWRHVFRNLAMLFWVIVVADYVVGDWLLHSENYLTNPTPILFDGAALPLPAQILLAFLASDLLDYLLHRAGHRFHWLWRLHSVHHSDSCLDATSAGRAHPLEVSIHVAGKLGLYVLLGLPLWIEGIRAIAHNPVSMIQHANVTFPAWLERLRLVFVTPAMHRLHHARERALHDNNLGVIFSFWDRLFGTYVAPEEVTSQGIGLPGYSGDNWQTVAGMLTTPVSPLPRPSS